MTAEPHVNEDTLRELRLYAEYDDDGEADYCGVWAVHGSDEQVEYPIATYADELTVTNSADPSYSEIDGHVLDEQFFEFLAGQAARLAEEGTHVFHDMGAFAPDEMDGIEVWAARTMLSTLAEGVIPFEVEWAIENGMEIIGEEIDETTLDGIDDDE
jgi:hypothetical protein